MIIKSNIPDNVELHTTLDGEWAMIVYHKVPDNLKLYTGVNMYPNRPGHYLTESCVINSPTELEDTFATISKRLAITENELMIDFLKEELGNLRTGDISNPSILIDADGIITEKLGGCKCGGTCGHESQTPITFHEGVVNNTPPPHFEYPDYF